MASEQGENCIPVITRDLGLYAPIQKTIPFNYILRQVGGTERSVLNQIPMGLK